MDRQDQTSGLVWLGTGLFVVTGSVISLDIGTFTEPGAGLFPLIAGCLLVFLSTLILLKAMWAKGVKNRGLRDLWKGTHWPWVLSVTGALLLYSFLLERGGFVLTTVLLLIFLFRGKDPMRWGLAAGLSAGTAVASYVLFDRVLQVSLPDGFLGF